MRCLCKSSCFCDRIALRANPLASVFIVHSFAGLKCLSKRAFRKHSLSLLKVVLASIGSTSGLGTDFFMSSVRGQATLLYI